MDSVLQLFTAGNFGIHSSYLVAMVASLISSFLIHIIYRRNFASVKSGGDIDFAFFLIGPSVTTLMIAIQESLPLSLGLLGALSFIRFRNPVKDPEEIAYLLVVIAAAVAISVKSYFLCLLIIITALFGSLLTKKLRPSIAHDALLSINMAGDVPSKLLMEVIEKYCRSAKVIAASDGTATYSLVGASDPLGLVQSLRKVSNVESAKVF